MTMDNENGGAGESGGLLNLHDHAPLKFVTVEGHSAPRGFALQRAQQDHCTWRYRLVRLIDDVHTDHLVSDIELHAAVSVQAVEDVIVQLLSVRFRLEVKEGAHPA